jgi:hypothetical protein
MEADKHQAVIELTKRLPPSTRRQVLEGVEPFLSAETAQALRNVSSLPLKTMEDRAGNPFVAAEFNRHPGTSSYRSPFTNEYSGKEEGYRPSESRRQL